jgi:chitin disaccharide deacetylase
MTRTRLIVNADDFGLTPGVSDGILEAHRDGVVTSTSVLTVAPAFSAYAATLRDSGLPAGLHLCLVGEDPPLLSRSEIPTLVDTFGRFPLDWRQVLRRSTLGSLDPADLRREFTAQLEALRQHGITPTHLDAHQNLHLWPPVLSVVFELAERHGVRTLRLPGTRRLGPVNAGVRSLAALARRRADRIGLRTPDHADGLDDAGHLGPEAIRRAVDRFCRVGGRCDLTVHPGVRDDPDRNRYRWGYTWPDELAALCDPNLRDWFRRRDVHLESYDSHTESSTSDDAPL